MSWIFPILHVLAVNGVVEAFHHGSLFDRTRYWLETAVLDKPIAGKVAEGLLCPFCFSYWVSLTLALTGWLAGLAPGWAVPVLWFSGARGAQLINDFLHDHLRTPGSGSDDWVKLD